LHRLVVGLKAFNDLLELANDGEVEDGVSDEGVLWWAGEVGEETIGRLTNVSGYLTNAHLEVKGYLVWGLSLSVHGEDEVLTFPLK
jgi:hypothetical protein